MSTYAENLAAARARWPSPRDSDDPMIDPLPTGKVDAAWLGKNADHMALFALHKSQAISEAEFRAALLEWSKRSQVHAVMHVATTGGLPGELARQLIEAHAAADADAIAEDRNRVHGKGRQSR